MRRALAFAALLFGATCVQACGHCVEDKIASVYDHALVTRALADKHQVVFFHIEGPLSPGAVNRQALQRLADSTPGSDKGTLRVSQESAALSIAFDPRRVNVAALQKELERGLAARRLSLLLLQVMDRPADFSPSAARKLRASGQYLTVQP